jgi:glutamate/tyrosine decarboxylase-like PLP-dependent enzyme
MELSVMRALSQMLSFKAPSGVLQPGGSASNMLAMITARAKMYPDHRKKGASRCKEVLTVFTSEASHYSIDKSAGAMGLGLEAVIKVPITNDGQMMPLELKRVMRESFARGETPYFVNCTSGTTVLSAYDNLREIVAVVREIEKEFNVSIWVHSDGSYGGCALFSEQWRAKLLDGVEEIDSMTVSPHKILGVPMQCSMLLINGKRWGRRVLWEANGLKASYLFHGSDQDGQSEYVDPDWDGEEDSGFMYDLGDATIGCGRRADALKLFLSWTFHGTKGWSDRVDQAFESTDYLARALTQPKYEGKFHLVLPLQKNQVYGGGRLSVSFWCVAKSILDRFGSLENFKNNNPTLFNDTLNKSTRVVHRELSKRGRFMIDFMGLSKPVTLPSFIRVAISSTMVTKGLLEELAEEMAQITDRLIVEFADTPNGSVILKDVFIRYT